MDILALTILVGYLGVSQSARRCLPPSPARSANIYRPSPSSTLKHRQELMTDTEMSEDVMADAEKSEGGEKESPPLQIDPKWYAQSLFLTWMADC